MRVFVLVACIAACGRIGFTPTTGGGGDDVLGDGGVPGDEIGVSLVTDGDGGNAPIENAVVLIDRGNGMLERVTTNAAGVAVFGATAPTRFVLVYSDTANSWRVSDIDAVPPGTVVHFGARPSPATDHATEMTLPTIGGSNTEYRVTIPGRCGYSPNTSGNVVGALYVAQCEGQSVHVIGEAISAGVVRGFDAGQVALTNHGAATLSGTYVTGQTYTVNVANVPAAAAGGTVDGGLALLDPDFGVIELGDFNYQAAAGTTATVMPQAEPLGNALVLDMYGGGTGAYEWNTSNVTKRTITNPIAADARSLLPIVTTLSLPPSANTAAWTLAAETSVAPAIFAYEANIIVGARTVRWTAYRGAGTTALQFPMLPADLAGADPTNGTWSHAMVVGIAYPGASYAGLIPTVDRVWQTWGGPVAGGYVTSDNFSVTQNFYDAGLGPP